MKEYLQNHYNSIGYQKSLGDDMICKREQVPTQYYNAPSNSHSFTSSTTTSLPAFQIVPNQLELQTMAQVALSNNGQYKSNLDQSLTAVNNNTPSTSSTSQYNPIVYTNANTLRNNNLYCANAEQHIYIPTDTANPAGTTSVVLASTSSPPNTILITNNFLQQQNPIPHMVYPNLLSSAQNAAQQAHTVDTQQQQLQADNNLLMNEPYALSINDAAKLGVSAAVVEQPSVATHIAASGLASQVATPAPLTPSNSTVVLDRINICINNHYLENTSASNINLATERDALSSPIIPAIHHHRGGEVSDSNSNVTVTAYDNRKGQVFAYANSISIIDEPDSTTTTTAPGTPTPSTSDNTCSTENLTIQSPTTSSSANVNNEKVIFSNSSEASIKDSHTYSPDSLQESSSDALTRSFVGSSTTSSSISQSFKAGEDVFIRLTDGKLYLGTVINSVLQRYLVRFDDGSEQWCLWGDMRKLGVPDVEEKKDLIAKEDICIDAQMIQSTMCIVCKTQCSSEGESNNIETCERCCRGYHRKCTTETNPGSGSWMCKRCDKPMKISCPEPLTKSSYSETASNWDKTNAENDEQALCYCRKSNDPNENMLPCCKCKNWYHVECMTNFKYRMLRGDGFFVFCCSLCSNNGFEFLRRLQMNWVDLAHLVLYNLSAKKTHHQKYHHLFKDIYPFALENRKFLPLPQEWIFMNESVFKEKLRGTLRDHSDRFVCGREAKRDNFFFALRYNCPPILPKIVVDVDDNLSDEFLKTNLKLKLAEEAGNGKPIKRIDRICNSSIEYDDGNYTSEDEVPIKSIISKIKINKQYKMKDNIEDVMVSKNDWLLKKEIDDSRFIIRHENSSRKRKAFTLSNAYKKIATSAASKQYDCNRNNDSSSDENSNSSRGTSLDVIIPAPKNFLGSNNPFLIASPKKNTDPMVGYQRQQQQQQQMKAFNVFNTSELVALKNAGMFPNLSKTNLMKAAGQPRTVRTIKRRLSAKDITIGPNQEIRRKRTRIRKYTNVEVISSTTINPLPTEVFPLNTKNIFSREHQNEQQNTCVGRRNSTSSTTSSSLAAAAAVAATSKEHTGIIDMNLSLNKYFGKTDQIFSNEEFIVCGKRQLPNGKIQYLLEWSTLKSSNGNSNGQIASVAAATGASSESIGM